MGWANIWAALRAFCYSVWVCRVSVLSVVVGLLLFCLADQAQAVFLDLHTREIALRHWPAFYLSLLLFWMLPVQLGARVMLHAGQDRVEDEDARWYNYLMVHLPWVLALFCLLAVGWGQYLAMDHIPGKLDPGTLDLAAAAQLRTLQWITVALAVLWLVTWVVLPPVIHRLTVRRGLLDLRLLRFIATMMFGRRATTRGYGGAAAPAGGDDAQRLSPEQLQSASAAVSLAVILVVSIFLVFNSPLEVPPSLSRAPMFPILVGAWLPLLTLLAYGAHRLRLPVLAVFVVLMTLIANWMPGLHTMRVVVQTASSAPLEVRQPTLEDAILWWRKANTCEAKLNTPCNVRPIIVAGEGGASRAGFFTGSLLAHLEDLSSAGDGSPVFSKQLFAISSVSGSTLGAAAFAALLEDSQGEAWPRPADEPTNDALWFKSGKAQGVGGVEKVPLPTAPTRKDILQQILAGDFLTPVMSALALDLWVPWHPAFYSGGDRAYFLERSWEQRYADPSGRTRKGKTGFDRPFSSLAPQPDRWRPILVFNGTSVTTGRRIITSTLYPLIISPDDPIADPKTDKNIESVFRGSYDLYSMMCLHEEARKAGCVCEQRALGELHPLRMKGCDIRLSTAVSNSARFPIISPHGDIPSGSKVVDRVVDGGYFDYSGIVSALELRAQIMRIDEKLNPFVLFATNDPGFTPRFSPDTCEGTDPQPGEPDELDVLRAPAPPPGEPIDPKPFSILAYPLDTLLNGRISRGEQTMANAVLLNRQDNLKQVSREGVQSVRKMPDLKLFTRLRSAGLQSYLNFDVVSVGAPCNSSSKQVRPVPMSWWLTMPTQAYLDSELCARHNRKTIASLLSQLGPQPDDDDRTAHLERYQDGWRRVARACLGSRVMRTRQVR
jgi:hypothetical protein